MGSSNDWSDKKIVPGANLKINHVLADTNLSWKLKIILEHD